MPLTLQLFIRLSEALTVGKSTGLAVKALGFTRLPYPASHQLLRQISLAFCGSLEDTKGRPTAVISSSHIPDLSVH